MGGIAVCGYRLEVSDVGKNVVLCGNRHKTKVSYRF